MAAIDKIETLNSQLTAEQILEAFANALGIKILLAEKVDKIDGKQLSTEDFTTEYKDKLDGLHNYDDTDVRSLISELAERVSELEGEK